MSKIKEITFVEALELLEGRTIIEEKQFFNTPLDSVLYILDNGVQLANMSDYTDYHEDGIFIEPPKWYLIN